MTKEDKELLLKDLCARLPYGVFAWYHSTNGKIKGYEEAEFTIIVDSVDVNSQLINYRPYYEDERVISSINVSGSRMFYDRKDMVFIKPYLRPMSNMTEEEKNELKILTNGRIICNNYNCISTTVSNKSYYWNTSIDDWLKVIKFLLENHFDFNNLIPKNLALPAPEDMYNF